MNGQKDDGYWLKLYHLAFGIDTKTLDVLKDRSVERSKFLDDLLIDIENYDLIDFNTNSDSNLNSKKS